ncbi:13232_t:CDS:2, partial [Ambispora leptoticha]
AYTDNTLNNLSDSLAKQHTTASKLSFHYTNIYNPYHILQYDDEKFTVELPTRYHQPQATWPIKEETCEDRARRLKLGVRGTPNTEIGSITIRNPQSGSYRQSITQHGSLYQHTGVPTYKVTGIGSILTKLSINDEAYPGSAWSLLVGLT